VKGTTTALHSQKDFAPGVPISIWLMILCNTWRWKTCQPPGATSRTNSSANGWSRGEDPPIHLRRAPKNAEIFDMSKKGITGHDEWVVTEALATALVALEQLPPQHQPRPHMEDIRKLLTAGCQHGTANLHLAQAKCRLFPAIDRLTIYREYGLEDGQA
jgi:hypothetical protein